MPRPSHSRFDHPNNIGGGLHIINVLIMWFSPLPCYLVPLRPKYSPQHPIFKHSQLTFLTQCEWPNFTPIQNNRQNYSSMYITFVFLGDNLINGLPRKTECISTKCVNKLSVLQDQEIVHINACTYASLSPWAFEPRINCRLSADVNKLCPDTLLFCLYSYHCLQHLFMHLNIIIFARRCI